MKIPKHIEVVRSNVKGLSSLNPKSAHNIIASLSQTYSHVVLTTINNSDDVAALIARKPDLVFLGIKRTVDSTNTAKRVWVSELLEQAGIPHTGSTSPAHQLELFKDRAKQRIIEHGLATAPFCIISINRPYRKDMIDLEFPLFVKPLSGGGGQGIDQFSVVHTPEQLHEKVLSLRRDHSTSVLVEQYLEGREFSVAIINDAATGKLTAMPLELIAPQDVNGDRMLSNSIKSADREETFRLENLTEHSLISTFALDAFRALGARDYGRIDIRLDGEGIPHFLEANLIPSLISDYGSFPKAYKLNEGVEYDEMIGNIAALGLTRTAIIA